MKTLIFFILIAFFSIKAQEPYPFKVGNQWDYFVNLYHKNELISRFHKKIQILETKKLSNGKNYFRFSPSFLFFDYRFEHRIDSLKIDCLRADSGKVYFYDYKDSCEKLYFNIRENYQKEYTNYFNSLCSYFDVRNDDNSGFVRVTDLFGIIYYHQADISPTSYSITLEGCIIDGKKYGEITNVDITKDDIYFSLSQNFPNPFNPLTTISYSIPYKEYVVLKIYDMRGCEVKTLVKKDQNAGDYIFQFDGSSIPSGMYIYTLQAGNFRKSKKFLLLK